MWWMWCHTVGAVLGTWLVQSLPGIAIVQHLLLLHGTFGEEVATHKPNLRGEVLCPRPRFELVLWSLGLVKLSTVEFQQMWLSKVEDTGLPHCTGGWRDLAVARGHWEDWLQATAVRRRKSKRASSHSVFNYYTGYFNINRMKGCRRTSVKMRFSKCERMPCSTPFVPLKQTLTFEVVKVRRVEVAGACRQLPL